MLSLVTMVDQSDSLHLSAPQLFHSHIIVWTAINLTSHFTCLISPLMSRRLRFQFVWYPFLEKLQLNNERACRCHCLHSGTPSDKTHARGHALAVALSGVQANWRSVFQKWGSQHLGKVTSTACLQGLLPVKPFHFKVYYVSSTGRAVLLPEVEI